MSSKTDNALPFDFDMLREVDGIIAAFERVEIRYALAGGFAVAIYGRIRATKDVDFICHPDDVGRATDCLAEAGYKTFAEPWTFRGTAMALHRFMKPGPEPEWEHIVDLLVPPVDRLHWIHNAERLGWGEQGKVNVVSRQDLVEMKKLRGSVTDRSDIEFLERGT